MKLRFVFWIIFLAAGIFARADGLADNLSEGVRRIPPPGMAISADDRAELERGVAELKTEIDSLPKKLRDKPALLALLPDVQIFYNAVRYPLACDEFFKTNEIQIARELLREGLERAHFLRDGKAPWTTTTGLVVRGYVSKIDGSVQPFGLVVPNSFQTNLPLRHRLDLWFHGRGETLTELDFIHGREKSFGEFTPPDAFVLHLYGRYCNANKFAGEVDAFEALDAVKKNYRIDENRIVARGFSMGGAACWHFAVHHAGLLAAAAPGAGFAETAEFLKTFQNEIVAPPWYEKKLWHLYDATDYALNLFNCPTVAYSGEIDKQKQAADIMAKALAKQGMELTHIIGPQTAHQYHPEAKEEINRRIDSIVARGRNPVPKQVRFTTWTLRYNQMFWVTVDSLDRHWERAQVEASIVSPSIVQVTTKNISALTLSMPPGFCPLDNTERPLILIDGEKIVATPVPTDRSWTVHLRKYGNLWRTNSAQHDNTLRKQHGLQGPIDDAFMDSFIMVRPTGKLLNEKVGAWVAAEQNHAIEHWRRQFRGEARVKNDDEISAADIASSNLILWGDPSSNKLLAKIAARLPIRWDSQNVQLGQQSFSAAHYLPILIYPNPLNPKRYVVVNSGFTFREYDYLNNARQVPKLPDFAIVDLNTPANPRVPGEIITAGFFDEHWELPKN